MALYAADLASLGAAPVKTKKQTKKQIKEQEVTPPESEASVEVKQKKPPTEKQLAARAKFAENRKKKLEEQAAEKLRLEQEIADKQKEIEAKEAAIAEKKKVRAEKRKAKKQEMDIDTAVEEAVAEPVEAPPAKKVRVAKKKKDDSEPPVWFSKFVESAKMEENKISNEKKPAKQVKEEAKETAKEQWGDGYTRDRVTEQVDKHMGKLYSMIFARK